MQNIVAILKELGIDVHEDKQAELNRKLSENYVTRAEHDKKLNRVETERDNYKSQFETADATLKGFDGIDIDGLKAEVETYKSKAEQAAADYAQKLSERDFNDALRTELDSIKFTSGAARKAVEAEIRGMGLKLTDGKIYGLHDVLDDIKARDAGAFVDETAETAKANAAKFTAPANRQQTQGNHLREKYQSMTLDERAKLKAENPTAYAEMRGNI